MRPTPEGVGNVNAEQGSVRRELASMRPTPEGVGNNIDPAVRQATYRASMRPTPEGVGNVGQQRLLLAQPMLQ